MFERRSLKAPIILGVILIVLLVLLIVGWVLMAVTGALRETGLARFYWTLLTVGATVFAIVLTGVILYLTLTIKAINLNRRQTNFIDAVTHELKSPIASLKLCLQTLSRRNLPREEQDRFRRLMLEDIERLNALFDHLLDAGRADRKREASERVEPFDLGEVLRYCAQSVGLRYGEAAANIQLDLQPAWVVARLVDLQVVFRNLIDNAVKYAGAEPEVRVTLAVSEDEAQAIVTVADNGRGIPLADRRRIFGRFVRLGMELRRDKPGTGLGLHIVSHARAKTEGTYPHPRSGRRTGHGFRSSPSPGARHENRRFRSSLRRGGLMSNASPHATDRPRQILVVEDEEHLAIGIKYNLEAEGYQVIVAHDGPTALQKVESGAEVDLVILDIMLPGMSGYGVCEALRDQGNMVPVLLLTARTLPEDRARGFDAGANQYLTKPFDLDELLSRVKNLMRLHRAAPAAEPAADGLHVYRFANVEVNFDSHEVTVDGKLVRLTKLELDLLRYFVRNELRVVSRDELLREVWQLPPVVTSRAPDQFVARLRKLFEPRPAKPRYFLTIRETGYRFVPGGDSEDEGKPDGEPGN